jgi:hypothetical protein
MLDSQSYKCVGHDKLLFHERYSAYFGFLAFGDFNTDEKAGATSNHYAAEA